MQALTLYSSLLVVIRVTDYVPFPRVCLQTASIVLEDSSMRIALYARVSTLDKGQDVTMQTCALREYCQRRGWDVVDEYVDSGISGSQSRRPQLDRMMADARRRKFDVVCVWKFDRFARSVSHLLRALEEFDSLGVQFVSLTEAIDTSSAMGKMLFTILGSVAELERGLIRERTVAGLRHARAKGKVLGRPRKTVSDGQILALRQGGASLRSIAAITGISHTMVASVCKKIPSETVAATA